MLVGKAVIALVRQTAEAVRDAAIYEVASDLVVSSSEAAKEHAGFALEKAGEFLPALGSVVMQGTANAASAVGSIAGQAAGSMAEWRTAAIEVGTAVASDGGANAVSLATSAASATASVVTQAASVVVEAVTSDSAMNFYETAGERVMAVIEVILDNA